MLKKIFISTNPSFKNNLYLSNIIKIGIIEYRKLVTIIFSKNNAYFFNLKSNLC